jgi:hypothetical protein
MRVNRMSSFPGGLSPEEHIDTLAAIMIESHGADAEQLARQRSRSCARRLEPEWSGRWFAVAAAIAERRRPKP